MRETIKNIQKTIDAMNARLFAGDLPAQFVPVYSQSVLDLSKALVELVSVEDHFA